MKDFAVLSTSFRRSRTPRCCSLMALMWLKSNTVGYRRTRIAASSVSVGKYAKPKRFYTQVCQEKCAREAWLLSMVQSVSAMKMVNVGSSIIAAGFWGNNHRYMFYPSSILRSSLSFSVERVCHLSLHESTFVCTDFWQHRLLIS